MIQRKEYNKCKITKCKYNSSCCLYPYNHNTDKNNENMIFFDCLNKKNKSYNEITNKADCKFFEEDDDKRVKCIECQIDEYGIVKTSLTNRDDNLRRLVKNVKTLLKQKQQSDKDGDL